MTKLTLSLSVSTTSYSSEEEIKQLVVLIFDRGNVFSTQTSSGFYIKYMNNAYLYMYVYIFLKLLSFMYFAKYFACCTVRGSSRIKSTRFLSFSESLILLLLFVYYLCSWLVRH